MSYVGNLNLVSSRLWCSQLSTHGTEIWGGGFRNFSLEGFRDGHEDIQDVSQTSKCVSSTTYHILLAKIGELLMELCPLKLTMSFQQQLAHLSSYWLVNQTSSISQHLVEQGVNT